MDTRSLLILVPVLVIPWIILLIILSNSKKKVIGNFRKLSEKYGLDCDVPKKSGMKNRPSAEGTYRSRNVRIETVVTASIMSKKPVPHTLLKVACPNSDGFTFNVVRKNKQNNAAFQTGSTSLGDAEFDGKFLVQTSNGVRMKKIFDFNTRFKLDQVHALGFAGSLSLAGNDLLYTEKGLLSSDDSLMRFELVLHEFCDIADVMKYD